MMQLIRKIPIVLLSFIAVACMDDDAITNIHRQEQNEKEHGIFIINEGNFMSDNASLSYYNPKTKQCKNDVFYNTNALPLGDVAQSMTVQDSLGYIVVNNSGKIYVINTETFKYVGKITGLKSPRYILLLNDFTAFVSDLYDKAITIVNPQSRQITGRIDMDNHNTEFTQHTSEQMVFYDSLVFIASWSYDNKIMVVDANTFSVVDSITVTKQPNSLLLDKNNKLWVLSDGAFEGSSYGHDTATLTRINPKTLKIETIFRFPNGDSSPRHLCCNKMRDTLYFISNSWSSHSSESGVYQMPIQSALLPKTPLIAENERTFYGLLIDIQGDGSLYVSDAGDFSSAGYVYRYTVQGFLVDSFKVGINPGNFCSK